MKKIIAIFSVMLTFGVMLPNDGWGERGGYGAGNCILHACKVDEDTSELLSQTGKTEKTGLSDSKELLGQKCFHCDAINHNDDCRFNDIVATVNGTDISVFVCNDDNWVDDTWEQLHPDLNTLPVCASSQLLADARGAVGVAEPVFGHNNARITQSKRLSTSPNKWGDQSKFCVFLECKPHYTPASDKKSCISENVETDCRDSHGYWDVSKCLCGATDRKGKDNKGDGQEYEVQDQKCKCSDPSYIWDDTEGKCVNPDQQKIDACDKSGGDWKDGECDCTDVEPKKKQDSDKLICVENTKYTKCEKSHGDWTGGVDDGKCICDETNKGLVPSGEVCVCKDPDAIWNGKDKCDKSPRALCEGTGGKFTPLPTDPNKGTCDCKAYPDKNVDKKDGSDPVQCECKSEDYDWKADDKTQGCKLKSEAEKRKQEFEKSKADCEAWGGTWSPEHWEWEYNGKDNPDGRDPLKWKCDCPDGVGVVQATSVACKCDTAKGYHEMTPKKCTPTKCEELKTKCEAVQGAEYKNITAHGGQESCECGCDDNKEPNYSTNKCEAIKSICDFIDGAKLDPNGICVCKSDSLPPVNGKCLSVTNSGSASGGGASSGGAVSSQEIARAKQKVSEAYDVLISISDGFGRSHWKTASGNFNGARLASDSIAGVVLGTVGGVVTSNVIKKNQVKGGFESLQCTVGGQLVADFGDQFQVGIR